MKTEHLSYTRTCISSDVYIYFIEGIEDRIFVLLNYMFYICPDVHFDFGDFRKQCPLDTPEVITV